MTGSASGPGGRRPRPAHGARSPGPLDLFAAPDAHARPPAPRPRARTVPPAASTPNADPGATAGSAISVSTLTRAAKDIVEGAIPALWVRGEVSNFTAHRNGHWYFTLRDEQAQLRCVIWARDTPRVPAAPDDGMQVSALGQLSVYPARGEMRLLVTRMDAAGDGLWRKALEASIQRLTADGLLAAARKRPLTAHPRRIAVITSPDGAALHDIIAVVRRRCPIVEIVVVSASVQGDAAARELVAAIDRVSRWHDVDTVIVGRGGGSREDLWAFNDERVARALARCSIPTISAVGHEVDVSLCDLVADLRAATPSAAAEAAVPVLDELRVRIITRAATLRAALERRAARARGHLSDAAGDVHDALERFTARRRARLEVGAGRLHALSPLATLARGYTVALGRDGHMLSSVAQFEAGLAFRLRLRDGRVDARAESALPDGPRVSASGA